MLRKHISILLLGTLVVSAVQCLADQKQDGSYKDDLVTTKNVSQHNDEKSHEDHSYNRDDHSDHDDGPTQEEDHSDHDHEDHSMQEEDHSGHDYGEHSTKDEHSDHGDHKDHDGHKDHDDHEGHGDHSNHKHEDHSDHDHGNHSNDEEEGSRDHNEKEEDHEGHNHEDEEDHSSHGHKGHGHPWDSELRRKHHEHKQYVFNQGQIYSVLSKISSTISEGDAPKRLVMTVRDMGRVLKKLQFKSCSFSEQERICSRCLSENDVENWFSLSSNDVLSAKRIQTMFVSIVYLLSLSPYEKYACRQIKEDLQGTKNVYATVMKKYGQDDFNESTLQKILERIKYNDVLDLKKDQCFSSHDILYESEIFSHTINAEQFNRACAHIVQHLLSMNCIDLHPDHVSSLPDRSFFIESLFEDFGNNSTRLSFANFQQLYRTLTTSKQKQQEESGHKHRKRRAADGHDHEGHGHEEEGHGHEKHKEHGDNDGHDGHTTFKCYTSTDVLKIFKIDKDRGLNVNQFKEVCPAILQQIDKSCSHEDAKEDKKSGSSLESWSAALISNIIISAGSLIGVLAAPLSRKSCWPYLLMFLISLAVMTLIGDAVLHLFPHALGLHGHVPGQEHLSIFEQPDNFLWKCVMLLVGIYVFFTFEIFMHSFAGKEQHSHLPDDEPDKMKVLNDSHKKLSPVHSPLKMPKRKSSLRPEDTPLMENNNEGCGNIDCDHLDNNCDKLKTKSPSDVYYDSRSQSVTSASSYSSDGIKEKGSFFQSLRAFKSVVWMVFIGDAIHNFMDGVAVGVAFTEEFPAGLHGGISTSIAILCHELPHELGDFAILLASGLSIKQALLMNFISSLTSFAGAILGVSIGTHMDANPWIFSITAGLFIYIALVDMLPELLSSPLLKKRPWLSIGVQNAGLLTGFLLMFALGAWEEDIKNAF